MYSYFDGKTWSCGQYEPEKAMTWRTFETVINDLPWRGVLK
jgi:hypothetical protein